MLILDGEGEEYINGVRHELRKGTLIFLTPYQIHEIKPAPHRPMWAYTCNFDSRLLDLPDGADGSKSLIDDTSAPFVQLDSAHYGIIEACFEQMYSEYACDHSGKHSMLLSKLVESLTWLKRIRAGSPSLMQENRLLSRRHSVWDVIRYLNDNYRSDISLMHLSQQFHTSSTNLSEMLKRHLGKNYVDLLHEIRIRNACSLLQSTDLPITQIAFEVGFGSLPTFFRAFKKIKGVSPSHYKNSF
jgi:AraC-like DNA-binding protein